MFYSFILYALINVKSEGDGGSGKPREFDWDVYPQGGFLIGPHAFDLSISNSRREVNHLFLLILTIIFCPNHDWL